MTGAIVPSRVDTACLEFRRRLSRAFHVFTTFVFRGLSDLHKEGRVFHAVSVVSIGAYTQKSYASGGHLAAQITQAKRPRTTIYHRTARTPRYIPFLYAYTFVSFWSSCRAFVLALSLYERSLRKRERERGEGKRRASTGEIKFSGR